MTSDSRTRGAALLADPRRNRSTAFSADERRRHGLEGLLPARIESLEEQLARVRNQLAQKPNDIERYIYLASLEDISERLFYALLAEEPERWLPIVYTPTVGEACKRYGALLRRPAGLYLSEDQGGRFDAVLANWPEADGRAICITSGGRTLGLGDLGANAMGIAIGKLQLYTACAGVPPHWLIPAHFDFGTDNDDLRRSDFYLGLGKSRSDPETADRLLDEAIRAALARFPGAMIHFEDWKGTDALRLLDRYRDEICCFNDDIQGTGAVALAGLLSALQVTGGKLSDQRILFLGAGSAAIGIARLLASAMVAEGLAAHDARRRLALFDMDGLIVASRNDLSPDQRDFQLEADEESDFTAAIRSLTPTAIIGVSGAGGAFDRGVIETLAELNERPVVFALSNPTESSECTAEEAWRYSNGRALFASGSPFDPVDLDGTRLEPAQANNMAVFPGIGLAVTATRARRVTDGMLLDAADAVATRVSDEMRERGLLLPPIRDIREVCFAVAVAVADRIFADGLTDLDRPPDIAGFLGAAQYDPA